MTIEELRSQILLAPYPDLEPHVRRGALFLVGADLDLAEVAWVLARNEAAKVEAWLANGKLLKAGEEDLTFWKRDKSFLRFLVVQPFVLAQIEIQLEATN